MTDTGDGASPPLTSTEATVSIAVNDAPVANPQMVSTNEDTPLPITLTGSDPNGDMLSYMVVANPTHGVLSGTAPNPTHTPAADYNGSILSPSNSDGTPNPTRLRLDQRLTPVNNPPTISDIPDTSIDEDTNTGAISFTVGDAETPAGSLTVSGTSSNTALVHNENIIFGGDGGANRTVTITPAPNANGTTTITVSVDDGTEHDERHLRAYGECS